MTSEFFSHFNARTLFLIIFLQTDFTKSKMSEFLSMLHTSAPVRAASPPKQNRPWTLSLQQSHGEPPHCLLEVNHTVHSKWNSFCIVAFAFSSLEKMKCGYFRRENKVPLIYCLYLEWWWMGLITQTSENCWVENVVELLWSFINWEFKCLFFSETFIRTCDRYQNWNNPSNRRGVTWVLRGNSCASPITESQCGNKQSA